MKLSRIKHEATRRIDEGDFGTNTSYRLCTYYEVTDGPPCAVPGVQRYVFRLQYIEVVWRQEANGDRRRYVTARGRRILANGQEGASEGSHSWSYDQTPPWPEVTALPEYQNPVF